MLKATEECNFDEFDILEAPTLRHELRPFKPRVKYERKNWDFRSGRSSKRRGAIRYTGESTEELLNSINLSE